MLAERRVPTRAVRTVAEIEQQTETGELLLGNLLRAQLRWACAWASSRCSCSAPCPCSSSCSRGRAVEVAGVTPALAGPGLPPYPFMLALAWLYIAHGRAQRARLRRQRRGLSRDAGSTAGYVASAPSCVVAVVTVVIGSLGVRVARTTDDFLAASRTVGTRANAAAISGQYLSAASFLGVAGIVLKDGVDGLWYPVGFTAGYLALLFFVAAPLRRSGAYTVPDFAEVRLDSTLLRTVTTWFVVAIGWLYLLPQLQAAGLALNVLTDAPLWLGVVAVGLLVTASVTFGGMRSMTFVQAFQFWLKLTALAVPAVVLLVVFLGRPARDRDARRRPRSPTPRASRSAPRSPCRSPRRCRSACAATVDGATVNGPLTWQPGRAHRRRRQRAALPGRRRASPRSPTPTPTDADWLAPLTMSGTSGPRGPALRARARTR